MKERTLSFRQGSARMERFKVCWYHFPTGKSGINEHQCENEVQLLRLINGWNGSNPTTWHYWYSHYPEEMIKHIQAQIEGEKK